MLIFIYMLLFPGQCSKRRKSEGAKSGLDSSSCLAEPFEFVVLMSAHIALNRLWHLSSRSPLTRFLHCPKRLLPWQPAKSATFISSPSSSLESKFSTVRLPTFWPREGRTWRTSSYGRRRAWRAPMLLQSFTLSAYSLTQRSKMYVNNENLNFVKNAPIIYVNLIITVIIVSEKKIGNIIFVQLIPRISSLKTLFFFYFCSVCFTL